MSADKINKKIEITWQAVELYEKNGKVSIPDLVKATGKTASEIYDLFPNKKAILNFYYPALVFQYWAMIEEIEGFDEFEISEKFSNFIYTLFDMMSEHLTFVEHTFKKNVFYEGQRSTFHKEVRTLFKEFLTTDADIAVSAGFFMKDYYYSLLASQYLFLIKFWLSDDSENKERTLALTDKLTSLYQETVYNKTLDKGFDLLKFVFGDVGAGQDIPVFGDCLSELFGKKETNSKGEDVDE